MPEFKIFDLLPLQKESLDDGVFLLILNARTIPPHLLLTVSGKVFSVSTKGPSLDTHVDVYLKYIQKHNIESVFVKLKLPLLYEEKHMLDSVRKITAAYPRVDVGMASCLSPIKDFCNEMYFTETHDVHLIFDLLPKLKQQGIVEGYYQMNLDDAMAKGELSMKKYSIFDVNEAIFKSFEKVTR